MFCQSRAAPNSLEMENVSLQLSTTKNRNIHFNLPEGSLWSVHPWLNVNLLMVMKRFIVSLQTSFYSVGNWNGERGQRKSSFPFFTTWQCLSFSLTSLPFIFPVTGCYFGKWRYSYHGDLVWPSRFGAPKGENQRPNQVLFPPTRDLCLLSLEENTDSSPSDLK